MVSPLRLFQLRGLAVMVKTVLLAGAAAAPDSALAMFVIAIAIGGVSSHMPGKFRYYSLWHGRIVKESPQLKQPNAMMHPILFPTPRREFQGQRWVRITLRTAHLTTMAFLVGGVAVGHEPLQLPIAFWGTALTGIFYVALELFNTGVWLFQLRGLAVMVTDAS